MEEKGGGGGARGEHETAGGCRKRDRNPHRTHEAAEARVDTGDTCLGVDLDEDVLCRVDVHLEEAGLVQGRVEEHEEALVRDVGAEIDGIALVLLDDVCVVRRV